VHRQGQRVGVHLHEATIAEGPNVDTPPSPQPAIGHGCLVGQHHAQSVVRQDIDRLPPTREENFRNIPAVYGVRRLPRGPVTVGYRLEEPLWAAVTTLPASVSASMTMSPGPITQSRRPLISRRGRPAAPAAAAADAVAVAAGSPITLSLWLTGWPWEGHSAPIRGGPPAPMRLSRTRSNEGWRYHSGGDKFPSREVQARASGRDPNRPLRFQGKCGTGVTETWIVGNQTSAQVWGTFTGDVSC
jgi:hypothetical protein